MQAALFLAQDMVWQIASFMDLENSLVSRLSFVPRQPLQKIRSCAAGLLANRLMGPIKLMFISQHIIL